MSPEFRKVSPPRPVQVRDNGKWTPAQLEAWQLGERSSRALVRYGADGEGDVSPPVWVDAARVRASRER